MSEPTSPTATGPDCPDRRNELALIRTDLANERTLLSYGRTALMMAGTGGTLIKFFGEAKDMLLLGIGMLVLGGAMFVVGLSRFRMQHNRIHS